MDADPHAEVGSGHVRDLQGVDELQQIQRHHGDLRGMAATIGLREAYSGGN